MKKGIALLSGGIDSPVAIHLMNNRVDVIAIHFHQQPLSDDGDLQKVRDLATLLKIKKTYLVGFVNVFKAITENSDHRNYFILQKILMLRAAQIIATKEKATYLITGENLAQVSSQTLSNLKTITKHVDLEILRPVLSRDKQEIIDIAKKIGTFDISKGPEICALLGPKNPATKSDPARITKELEKCDYNSLIEQSLKDAEILTL